MSMHFRSQILCLLIAVCATPNAVGQIAVRGQRVYTMAGSTLEDGVVVIRNGKITAVGAAADIYVPASYEVLQAEVVTPGLIDAHCTVGISGIFNYDHDQDQLERSAPIQPQLRAVDAYNVHEPLVDWVRSLGVTTMHTGHAPGELISGQTMIVKTAGNTVEQAALVKVHSVAATLTASARKSDSASPGTRGKMIAMLRSQLIKAQEYRDKKEAATANEDQDPPERDLQLEAIGDVLLGGGSRLLVTADRAQDIASALRLAGEFPIRLILDSAAEAYLLIDEIKAADVAVIIHPTMARPIGDRENISFETASKLIAAGIPVAMQSGYEPYVPKTRVVLFEAALAAAHGLSFEDALSTLTVGAAHILGIDDRVGSLQVGMDGDVALFDGDPFEYTTHCVGTVINGNVVSRESR